MRVDAGGCGARGRSIVCVRCETMCGIQKRGRDPSFVAKTRKSENAAKKVSSSKPAMKRKATAEFFKPQATKHKAKKAH